MSKKTYFQYTPPVKTAWDDLPINEKADIMKSCVRNGIISPRDIRTAYNNYAAGKNILEGIPDYQANAIEFGNFLAGGGIKYGKPYYSYDDEGRKVEGVINYNATLPETVIIPDSRKSSVQRNEDERFRQRFNRNYAEQQARDYTTRQTIAAQREWENSPQKKALDLGIAAAQGIGMASDVVSPFFGGIPVYSGLKGAQALDRATSTNDVTDYVNAALWLSPMLTVAGKKVYDAAKPAIQNIFQKGTPAAEWAEGPQFSIGNGMIPNGTSEDIKPAIERGRNTLVDWLEGSFYKDRLKDEPLYRVADDVVADASSMVRDVPVAIKERNLLEDFANGVTSPRPFTEKVLPDGTIIRDFNTGLDVAVASDLGENADDVTLHELLHYMTSNSKGTPISKAGEKIIERGWFAPTDAYYNAIGIINRTRGKGWQNYVMDQNDVLLPKYDAVVKMVMEEPNEAKAALIRTGRTVEQAEAAVNSLRERYSYWYDIQEQRAHLQELFLSKIKPHLKNPNDAAEIETFLTEHPEILENSSPYKYIQEVRPGSLKQYAGYFASALGTVPFILNSGSNE